MVLFKPMTCEKKYWWNKYNDTHDGYSLTKQSRINLIVDYTKYCIQNIDLVTM